MTFKDAFGNTCEWYSQRPERCATSPMAATADGRSAATECEACATGEEVVVVAQMWEAPWSPDEEAKPCAPGACTMDSECGCPGSRCRAGVCECGNGCESYGMRCRQREDFGEPTVVPATEPTVTYVYWGFPLLGFILLLVMVGAIISATSKKARRGRMCFG